MGTEPYIPAATIEKLNGHYPPGTRHAGMFDIAMPMIGNGVHPDAVRAQLRATFPDADKTDKEIADVVDWCVNKNPTPSGFGERPRPMTARHVAPPQKPIPAPEKMDWWLNGYRTNSDAVAAASPHQIPANRELMPGCLFRALFGSEECINVLRQFTVNDKGKANPQGAGKSMTWAEWEEWMSANGLPEGEAGAWMRFNPTTPQPSGGGYADKDITTFRFMMIESDVLTLEQQLSFYQKCKLPIAAIVMSGGDSAHAWIRLDAEDDATYTAAVARIVAALEPFGFDKANKNPSRLTRLPGAKRTIGATGDGIQRLLWLNPLAKAMDEVDKQAFEAHLRLPLVSDLPFKDIFRRALKRYEELEANKGKLGVPTGIKEFDSITGGLKNGQMIVIAAKTGGGKTTLATNIINSAAWHNNIGVALFTLEMDRDEICDLLVSLNCSIDRNVFNNGNFSHHDSGKIAAHGESFCKLPLWISDEPVMTVEQIRAKVLQLKSEGRIGLVVVDYLQFISGGDSYKDNREQQIAGISRALRSLAKEAKLPVIALSQLNDEGKLRESRVIAHDAHVVLMVEEAKSGDLIARVEKGRSIPKGSYMLKFEKQYGRLTSVKMTYQDEPDEPRGHPNARRR